MRLPRVGDFFILEGPLLVRGQGFVRGARHGAGTIAGDLLEMVRVGFNDT